jgi:tRNA pseudouridine55 synthase
MTIDSPGDIVLRVDKPAGPTSHDLVVHARRALRTRRIGHTGTLDPFASGLLLLCINRATRLAEYLTRLDKSYLGLLRLDGFTATDDHTAEVTPGAVSWKTLDRSRVETGMQALTGTIDQVAPLYSAKKRGGERSYRRARRGEEVQPATALVTVRRFELLNLDLPEVSFAVDCSSGTYVRALARDLGSFLGTGGYLTQLRRTRIGPWDVRDAVPPAALENSHAWRAAALSPLQALAHLPQLEVDDELARRLSLGQRVHFTESMPVGPLAISNRGTLLAIARQDGESLLPLKVWTQRE